MGYGDELALEEERRRRRPTHSGQVRSRSLERDNYRDEEVRDRFQHGGGDRNRNMHDNRRNSEFRDDRSDFRDDRSDFRDDRREFHHGHGGFRDERNERSRHHTRDEVDMMEQYDRDDIYEDLSDGMEFDLEYDEEEVAPARNYQDRHRSSRDRMSNQGRSPGRDRSPRQVPARSPIEPRDRSPIDRNTRVNLGGGRERSSRDGSSRGSTRDRSPRDGGTRLAQDANQDRSMRDRESETDHGQRKKAGQSSRGLQDHSAYRKWISDIPSSNVLMTGLPPTTQEGDIYGSLHPFHSKVQDVRIVRDMMKACRGFAFIDFNLHEDATSWLEETKKTVFVKDHKVTLHYSIPSDRSIRKNFGWRRWATEEHSNNLVIWNIPLNAEISHIEKAFSDAGIKIRAAKILRDKDGLKSRGYGFLEFEDVPSAEKWMEESKGMFELMGQIVLATYSSGQSYDPRRPWICAKCGADNFKKRDFCFKCSLSRTESENVPSGDGIDEVGKNPCNTLIFRGLDALTTEETLNRGLQWTTGMFCKNVIIMRDLYTNVSMSYAFGEMASINEAKQIIEFLKKNTTPLEVDGKQILVSFAKNTYNTICRMANQPQQSTQQTPGTTAQDIQMEPVRRPQPETFTKAAAASPENAPAAKAKPVPSTESPKKKVPDTKKQKKSAAKAEKEVNYLDLNLLPTANKKYYYDPEADRYYNRKARMKCPVIDCRVKRGIYWTNLKMHWFKHIPTKRAYLCRHCKKKPGAFSNVGHFYKHLDLHKKIDKEQYEEELKKAKVKLIPNQNFHDPGTAVFPPPVPSDGPKINIPKTECLVEKCPHSYTTLESMKQHWAQYHSPMVTMYRCNACDTIDRDKKLMATHVEKKHDDTEATLEKVQMKSKQYIEPGNVVPFWSLYSNKSENCEEEDIHGNEDRLGPDLPLMKIPDPGGDPEDLCEFLSWTERYMMRLQNVHKGALRELKKLTERKLESK